MYIAPLDRKKYVKHNFSRRCIIIYNKRVTTIVLFFTILIFLLIYRLYELQIIEEGHLARQVIQQRSVDTTLKVVRGGIYDRRMIPFTDTEDLYHVVIAPEKLNDKSDIAYKLSLITGHSINDIEKIFKKNSPVVFVVKKEFKEYLDINLSQRDGIAIINSTDRYGEKSIARHIIGYVNSFDQTGSFGIEKAFDNILHMQKTQNIGIIGNALKRSIPGLGYKISEHIYDNNGLGIKLTLDFHIQKVVEEVMDKRVPKGAVIVVEADSGDIVALSSRPNYSQNNVEQYINTNGSELVNRAFMAYDIGSIFKIIVAAAALEQGIIKPYDKYNCKGYIDVEGKKFNCSANNGNGHGEIDFIEAFAHSCNTFFIDTGLKVGYGSIIEMAKRFGFGEELFLYEALEQHTGHIPEKKYVSLRETANTSIGQGEILVTPIQVADMITTIANHGVRKKLNMVDSIINERDGSVKEKISKKGENIVIDKMIALQIQNMMEQVTLIGTGRNANLDRHGGAAGKTGSAETGWVDDGETKVHAWFAGYFPVYKPKYSIVVFVENGRWAVPRLHRFS